MDVATAVWGLAGAVVVLSLVHVFKSPKEYHGDTMKRLESLEVEHNKLHRAFIESSTGLRESVKNLAEALAGLRDEVRGLAQELRGLRGRR